MAINYVKMYDPSTTASSQDQYKQQMALAQQLMGSDPSAVYSPAAGLATVASKAFGGWMARSALDEQKAADQAAWGQGFDAYRASLANTLRGGGGAAPSGSGAGSGAGTTSVPNPFTTTNADTYSTSIGNVPDPAGLTGDAIRSQNQAAQTGGQPADVGKIVFNELTRGGLSPTAAAGVLGNWQEESTLNPNAYNDKEGAIGLGQWRGDRATALKQFAAQQGGNVNDPAIQSRFFLTELPQYGDVQQALSTAKTPEDAAAAVIGYEKPGGWKPGDPTGVPSYQDRLAHALQFSSLYGGGGGGGGQPAPAGPVQVASLDPSVGVPGGTPAPQVPIPSPAPVAPVSITANVPQPPQATPTPGATPPPAQPSPVQVAQATPQIGTQAPAASHSPIAPPAVPQPTQAQIDQQLQLIQQLGANPRSRPLALQMEQDLQAQVQAARKAQYEQSVELWKMGVNRNNTIEDRNATQSFQTQQARQQHDWQVAGKNAELSNIDNGTETLIRDGQGNIVKTIPKKQPLMSLGPNNTAYNPNTNQPEFTAPAAAPAQVLEAQAAIADPTVKQTLMDLKRSGAANMSVDMKSENAEAAERGKGVASRLNKMADDGDAAAQELITIKRMNELGNNVDPGSRTAFYEDLRKNFGIQLDPNADNVQAFKAMINYMKPRMRVAGAGTSSDRDMDAFDQSIMNMRATPGGNEIIGQTLGGMAQWRVMRGDIAQKYQVGEINAKEAMDQIKALPDPFAKFHEWQSQNPNAPKGPAAARVDNPNNGLKAAPAPQGYPANAKQAADGNWYVPDQNRPGKYLKVQP